MGSGAERKAATALWVHAWTPAPGAIGDPTDFQACLRLAQQPLGRAGKLSVVRRSKAGGMVITCVSQSPGHKLHLSSADHSILPSFVLVLSPSALEEE